MAQYLGTVKLGGFYNNGAILKRPTRPWCIDSTPPGASAYGDIPSMSGSMANYTFGNTPSDDANKLQWVKIKDGDKTLLICDRVILVNVSWDDLNGQGYVTGKTVTIDGAKYKCRLLTGGSNYRNGDSYAGGSPTNNEWDRFITREEVISGLPAPVSSDLDTNQNSTDFNSAHNKFWNWFYVYSWCQETYSGNASNRAIRGYDSARYCDWSTSSTRDAIYGFRPVLEILNTDPLISDSDRNLGDKNQNFTIEYTVDDADSGDVLAATESIDGRTTKSFAPTRKAKNTISINIREHSLGSHTVKVVVTDGQGGTATRTWTFTRVNSAPTISGSDTNLGDKNVGFTYNYTVDDADGDEVTVVEKLNDEVLRTVNNAPKGEQLSASITSEKLYALGLRYGQQSRHLGQRRPGRHNLPPPHLQADELGPGYLWTGRRSRPADGQLRREVHRHRRRGRQRGRHRVHRRQEDPQLSSDTRPGGDDRALPRELAHPHERGAPAPRRGRGRQLRDEREGLELLQEGDGHRLPVRQTGGNRRPGDEDPHHSHMAH